MTSSSPRTEILHCVQNDRVKGPSHDQCCLDFFPPDTRHPGSVSQPIGKPFNGQAKGLLWLTWRSYAGPPQCYIPPEGGSPQTACKAKPFTGRTLGAQGRQARRRHQPSRRSRVNLREYSFPLNPSQRPITSNVAHSKKALTLSISAF